MAPGTVGGKDQGRSHDDEHGDSSPVGLLSFGHVFLDIAFDNVASQHTTGGGHIGRTGGLHGSQGTDGQDTHGKWCRVFHEPNEIRHQVGLFATG